MRHKGEQAGDPRVEHALRELQDLIRAKYPEATFRVSRSADDANAIHLNATVDTGDPDEVLDLVIERLLTFQDDQGLPLHVIPLRPLERALEDARTTTGLSPFARH